jgi:hypothetical protein
LTANRKKHPQQSRPQPRPQAQVLRTPASIPLNQPQPVDDIHLTVRGVVGVHLEALEAAVGYPVVAYFLDEGAVLADEQMYHLFEHLRRLGHHDQLGLWISSRGGATEVPVKLVSLLREYTDRFTVLVPYRAHSAATQVALGADEIVMTPMSELGPVDPTRRHPLLPKEDTGPGNPIPISVQDLRHVLQFVEREVGGKQKLTPEAAATIYTALFEKVHPLAIGALEQSWGLAQQVCERVLSTHMDPEKDAGRIKAIVDRLSDHYKSHLYQIDRREAKEIGLKVRDATDQEADAMWSLLIAFMGGLQLSGDAALNGEPAVAARLGHITSAVGSTVGLGITPKREPGNITLSRWESRWWADEGAARAALVPGQAVPLPVAPGGPPQTQTA